MAARLNAAAAVCLIWASLCCGVFAANHAGSWSVISGCQNSGCAGVYGQQRFAAPGNLPGARLSPGTWTDNEKRLWMFGGGGFDSDNSVDGDMRLNDMWMYDPNQQWYTWVSGPSVRGGPGHMGTPGIFSADALPASRSHPVTWTSTKLNRLCMFGGYTSYALPGNKPGYTSDIWCFDPTSYLWAYFGGSNSQQFEGSYVDQGKASPSARPGPRGSAASWVDQDGKFWMFGGETALGTFTQPHYLSDLWYLDPSISQYAWMGGPAMPTVDQTGAYGTKGEAANINWPGGRSGAMYWTDSDGYFWMFGGYGVDSQGHRGFLNDLWKFDPRSLKWTWVSGSNVRDAPATFGELRKVNPGANAVPCSRKEGYMFGQKNSAGGTNLWLFGGESASTWDSAQLRNRFRN